MAKNTFVAETIFNMMENIFDPTTVKFRVWGLKTTFG